MGALKSFEELRLFVTESADASKKMKNIVHSFIKKSDFFEFLRVNENNSHVKIYIKASEKNDDFVTDIVMFVEEKNENVIIFLKAKIPTEELSDLLSFE